MSLLQMSLPQMSLTGGVMILAVIVIRALAIRLLPKRTFKVLWEIVAVRLLFPFAIPSALSVYSLLGNHTSAVGAAKTPQTVKVLLIGAGGQTSTVPNDVTNAANTVSIWTVIWIVGVLVCAMFFGIAYWKCRQEFRISLPVDNDFVKNWLSIYQQRRVISVRQSGRFSTPLTYGVFRPVILMPISTEWEDTKTLKFVLAHEYVHIRRFDSIMKFVLIVVLCIHWFNPLVWAMYIFANRDVELSCDETVVRLLGENTKAAYAQALIRMEETRSGLTPLCNSFSKNIIEERITAIMKIRKTTIFSFSLACFIVVGIATVFATSANAQPRQAESVEEDGKIEIVSKPDSVPQVIDNSGVVFKEDGKLADAGTNDVHTASPVQSNDIHGVPVEKTGAPADDFQGSNVICFDTEAELDEHFRALEANIEKGLDRYAGFEEMYAGTDTSAPVTYIVK